MNVVTRGPEAIAGSISNRLKLTGIIMEQIMESAITAIREIANVVPLMGLPCKKLTKTPRVMPHNMAKKIPVLNSLKRGFQPRGCPN